ncbi:MAG: GNAT family N-acetyltransferase [Bacillota bacterium]
MGIVRRARAEELGEIIALTERIFRKAWHPPRITASSPLFWPDNIDNLMMVEDAGRPVSFTGLKPWVLNITGNRIPSASLGLVCTDTAHRSKGYASDLVQEAIRQLEAEGTALLFISGDRDLYTRHGAVAVGQVTRVFIRIRDLLSAVPFGNNDDNLDFVPWQTSDLEAMLNLLEGENVFFERTKESFAELIRAQNIFRWYPAEQHIWVRKRFGIVDAYVVFGTWKTEEDVQGEVVEFAGSDEAVVSLLKSCASRLSVDGFTMCISNYRHTLANMLAAIGDSFQGETNYGTVRIIDFLILWKCLMPYFKERLGEEYSAMLQCDKVSNGYRISLGKDELIFDHIIAAKLVFNGPQQLEQGPIKEALSKLFPLSMVNPYNLNYI